MKALAAKINTEIGTTDERWFLKLACFCAALATFCFWLLTFRSGYPFVVDDFVFLARSYAPD